ncbi:MAG: mechanosensitive ion channel family protein [Ruminococcus sp.]|nr:mechanosensitive ion channel family protein [Ruminococcus sp.]
MNQWDKMLENIRDNILVFLIVIVVGIFLVKLLLHFLKKALLKSKMDHTVKTFLFSILRVLLYGIVAVTALGTIGVKLDSIIATLGAAAITAGLALQDTLKNFVSGMIILLSKPFTAGDLIEIEGVEGYVKSIRIFYTTVTTFENKTVNIPNSRLTSNNVTNCSSGEYRRVGCNFSVSYEDNLAKVKSVIFDVIAKNDLILHDPEPKVYISSHQDSGVGITVFAWAHPDNYFPVYFYLQEQVKLAFDENGITIPYPHVTLDNNLTNQKKGNETT